MSLPNNCNPKFNCLGHISSLSLTKIRSVDLGIIDTLKILMFQSHFVIFGILLYLILNVSLGRAQASRNHFFFFFLGGGGGGLQTFMNYGTATMTVFYRSKAAMGYISTVMGYRFSALLVSLMALCLR